MMDLTDLMDLPASTEIGRKDIKDLPPPPCGGQWITPEELEGLRAVPFYREFIDNDVSYCSFLLYDKAVHKNDTGDYCYYTLEEDQQEFFNWHDIVVSNKLTPLEDEFLEQMKMLEEANDVSAPLGFNLAKIEYIDNDNVFFTTYSDKLEVWFKFEGKDFASISAATYPQLATKHYLLNTIISPLLVKLDASGNVLQGVQSDDE